MVILLISQHFPLIFNTSSVFQKIECSVLHWWPGDCQSGGASINQNNLISRHTNRRCHFEGTVDLAQETRVCVWKLGEAQLKEVQWSIVSRFGLVLVLGFGNVTMSVFLTDDWNHMNRTSQRFGFDQLDPKILALLCHSYLTCTFSTITITPCRRSKTPAKRNFLTSPSS